MNDAAPCYGMGYLFDSTDIIDHLEAKKICDDCPLIEACKKRAAEAQRLAHSTYGPEGTWAGELYRSGKVSNSAKKQIRRLAEDALYSVDEARRCAGLYYEHGYRTPWIIAGRRVYERRNRNARMGQAAAS